ncbi:hypothetical protein [Spirillospora sp. NPDC047279]|uniref:hypothetical protein n=1 Tax=Spirillospora sp. NPDC047279 TaxID=3155478 RepID=UPI00340C015C
MTREPGSRLAAAALSVVALATTVLATASPASAAGISCDIPRYAGQWSCRTGNLGVTNLHQITVTARFGPVDSPPAEVVICWVYDTDSRVNVGMVTATRWAPTRQQTIPGLYNRYFASCTKVNTNGTVDSRGGGGGDLWND